MVDERNEKRTLPPYVPYRTFINFLDGLKDGVPSHIDKSVLKGMSGGMQGWMMSALKTTALIDDEGVPSDLLRKLAASEGPSRTPLLKRLFEHVYGFIREAGIDLTTTTPAKVQAAFEERGAKGETVEKCMAFMRALAKDSEVTLSRYLTQAAPRRRSAAPKPRKSNNGGQVDEENGEHGDGGGDQPQPIKPEEVLLEILDPDTMTEEETKAVWTLLLYLKKQAT
jgi:hypothetical protein